MKTLLAVFILAGALGASAQTQSNSPAVVITNIATQSPTISNAPVNAKVAMPTNVTLVVLDDETSKLLHEAAKEPFIKWDTVANAVLGAVLAIGVGLLADRLRENRDKVRKKKEDEEFERNTVLAIRREVESLGQIYAGGIGQQLKNTTTEIFPIRLAITQDWFTVFSANTSHLGKIDHEISRRIVATYALMKALIEEYRINNLLLDRFEAGDFTGWGTKLDGAFRAPMSVALSNEQLAISLLKAQLIRIRNMEALMLGATNCLYAILDERGYK